MKKVLISLAGIGTLLTLFFLIFTIYVEVRGPGMEPNLKDGSKHIFADISISKIDRGDIIYIEQEYVSTMKYLYVVRVIGLPGDSVVLDGASVIVNGVVLDEDYLPSGTKTGLGNSAEFIRVGDINLKPEKQVPSDGFFERDQEYLVPENSYFVLGDNRENVVDSRHFGYVFDYEINGELVF